MYEAKGRIVGRLSCGSFEDEGKTVAYAKIAIEGKSVKLKKADLSVLGPMDGQLVVASGDIDAAGGNLSLSNYSVEMFEAARPRQRAA